MTPPTVSSRSASAKGRTPRAESRTVGFPVPLRDRLRVLTLHALHTLDRLRFATRQRLTPELEVEPGASANFACARFSLAKGSRLVICAGAVTDRIPGALYICLGEGAEVVIGPGSWLRTEIDPVRIVAFDGARIELGQDVFLNGCHLSAKSEVRMARGASLGLGSRIFDSDQHDLDESRLEETSPVSIGEYTWVASGVTVLRGVSIGAHSVVGAHSLVTRDIPDHTLAFGRPAQTRGQVGDRFKAR